MTSQYVTEEIDRCFLSPIVPDLLLGESEPLVSIDFPKEDDLYSDVPNSRDVILKVDELVIVSSTRYQFSEFVEFARKLGWEFLEVAQASEDSNFRQLLLRRM